MIGTELTAAARLAAPSSLWRTTMTSAYPLTMRIVSSRVSPLAADENSRALSVPIVCPPRRSIAASKDRRVRGGGALKNVAHHPPLGRAPENGGARLLSLSPGPEALDKGR